jgi:hypothetical protein
MQMRVVREGRAPGVQHAEKANLGTQMLGIGCDRPQRLAGSAKEYVVHLLLILIGNSRHRRWQSKNDMKIWDIKKFGLSLLQPLGAI